MLLGRSARVHASSGRRRAVPAHNTAPPPPRASCRPPPSSLLQPELEGTSGEGSQQVKSLRRTVGQLLEPLQAALLGSAAVAGGAAAAQPAASERLAGPDAAATEQGSEDDEGSSDEEGDVLGPLGDALLALYESPDRPGGSGLYNYCRALEVLESGLLGGFYYKVGTAGTADSTALKAGGAGGVVWRGARALICARKAVAGSRPSHACPRFRTAPLLHPAALLPGHQCDRLRGAWHDEARCAGTQGGAGTRGWHRGAAADAQCRHDLRCHPVLSPLLSRGTSSSLSFCSPFLCRQAGYETPVFPLLDAVRCALGKKIDAQVGAVGRLPGAAWAMQSYPGSAPDSRSRQLACVFR